MDREDFFKKNDDKFLQLGFKKIEEKEDPFFYYEKSIMTDEAREEFLSLNSEEYEPKLLVGNTGLNNGICLYTGDCFVWLNVKSVEEAIEWGRKVCAIEFN